MLVRQVAQQTTLMIRWVSDRQINFDFHLNVMSSTRDTTFNAIEDDSIPRIAPIRRRIVRKEPEDDDCLIRIRRDVENTRERMKEISMELEHSINMLIDERQEIHNEGWVEGYNACQKAMKERYDKLEAQLKAKYTMQRKQCCPSWDGEVTEIKMPEGHNHKIKVVCAHCSKHIKWGKAK